MNHTIKWYLDYIKNELDSLAMHSFHGHVTFQVNLFKGNITNVLVDLHKSAKMPKEEENVGVNNRQEVGTKG